MKSAIFLLRMKGHIFRMFLNPNKQTNRCDTSRNLSLWKIFLASLQLLQSILRSLKFSSEGIHVIQNFLSSHPKQQFQNDNQKMIIGFFIEESIAKRANVYLNNI